MKVALTIVDHLRRAEQVYGDRIAVVDESDQPAASWGTLTYKEVARRARAQAAALDALGIPQGARVAIVSQNSARLLTAFFGVSAMGECWYLSTFAWLQRKCRTSFLIVAQKC